MVRMERTNRSVASMPPSDVEPANHSRAILGDQGNAITARLRRWFELPGERSGIPAMAGMRGLAVLLVFYVHAHDNLGFLLKQDSWLHRTSYFFGQIGHVGVDIFFLLSGYLIYSAAIKPSLALGRFWLRRVERIYPTFLAVFALYVLLSFLMPGKSKFPEGTYDLVVLLAGNLLLLAGLFPFEPVITVTWSLSFEIFYYLTIPLLILLTGMRAWPRQTRIAFFLALAAAFCLLFYGPLYRPGYWTPARLMMFVAGILLFEHLSGRVEREGRSGAAGDFAVAAIFLAAFPAFFWLYKLGTLSDTQTQMASILLAKVAVLAIATYLLCAHCFAKLGRLHLVFEWAPLRWLGNMSYSYYLIHALAVHATAQAIHALVPQQNQSPYLFPLATTAAFSLSLVLATILFLAVERPFSLDKKIKTNIRQVR